MAGRWEAAFSRFLKFIPVALRIALSNTINLLRGFAERMPVAGVAMHYFGSNEPTALAGGRNTHFAPELIALLGFAFADAFHMRFMNAVHLALICLLLLLNALGYVEQLPKRFIFKWSFAAIQATSARCRSTVVSAMGERPSAQRTTEIIFISSGRSTSGYSSASLIPFITPSIFQLGFSSSQYFVTVFKKYTKKHPHYYLPAHTSIQKKNLEPPVHSAYPRPGERSFYRAGVYA